MTSKEMALAPNTVKIGQLLAERMPHLEFSIWDLSEFMHVFHNVRRNIIFIECEKIALEEVLGTLAGEEKLRDYLFYTGERKPKSVNEEWATARSTQELRDVVVVIARKDFTETKPAAGGMRVPTIERRIVDLLAYSLREWLPISVGEAVDILLWFLKKGELRITFLQRYATRRYLGWFLDIALYKLEEKGLVNRATVDPRYIENGRRYLESIKRVDQL